MNLIIYPSGESINEKRDKVVQSYNKYSDKIRHYYNAINTPNISTFE